MHQDAEGRDSLEVNATPVLKKPRCKDMISVRVAIL